MTALPSDDLHPWRFDELVREGLSLIPAHAPQWTNHNASDPGITLVELLAYFSEMLVYRLGRVTPAAKLQFLRLLHGSGWADWKPLVGASAATLDAALDQAVRQLGQSRCAITAGDFEQLAIDAAVAHLGHGSRVRASCIAGADLEQQLHGTGEGDTRAHVTVVVVPERELEAAAVARLCDRVSHELQPHCLLSTRLHVIGPVYLHLALGFRLALRPHATRQHALDAIDAALRRRFGPWAEGELPEAPQPLGKPVRMTEVMELIDNTEDVDFVDNLTISGMSEDGSGLFDPGSRVGIQIGVYSTLGLDSRLGVISSLGLQRLQRDDFGRLSSIVLQPWEVVRLRVAAEAVQWADAAPPREGSASGEGDER